MVKAISLTVFTSCIFCSVFCEPVIYKDCSGEAGGGLSILKEVDITPCSPQPCILKRGSEDTIKVTFLPKVNITAAKSIVSGRIGLAPFFLPFPLDNPDVCKDHGIKCPMIAGKQYTFKTVLPILRAYPPDQVLVKWEMHTSDQANKVVFCWMVPVRIE
ncbi:NPC intracellular cholesterol transporter 2-like [Montipora foliosa]|uniref:NPC intracellular cholesterol transporter 2-like n=1 Tax=Montipora foliosa TaxID=591990 RepID=UPI0035F1E55F